jgi:adenosine deaminase
VWRSRCAPASNVALGVYATPADVPLRVLHDAGARLALGADDPLLFGSRLVEQYRIAREVHGFGDTGLAEPGAVLRTRVVRTADVRARLLAGIDGWLAAPPEAD